MVYKLAGVTLAYISGEVPRKSANLDPFTMPRADSNQTLVWDFNGAQLEITLDGKLVDTTIPGLSAQVIAFLNKISGQQSIVLYESEILGNKNVKIDSIDFNYEITQTGTLTTKYTIRLIESANV